MNTASAICPIILFMPFVNIPLISPVGPMLKVSREPCGYPSEPVTAALDSLANCVIFVKLIFTGIVEDPFFALTVSGIIPSPFILFAASSSPFVPNSRGIIMEAKSSVVPPPSVPSAFRKYFFVS